MSKLRYAICIEGVPWIIGTYVPTWHAGTLDDVPLQLPAWRQEIDALGGVARCGDIDIDIADPLSRWARFFRVVQPRMYAAISPNPILWDTTTGIKLRSATGLAVDNILYAENDTWKISAISGNDINVTRQKYSCLEAGWRCRYQTDVTREDTVLLSPDGPPSIMGRMVAIYVSDKLEFLGQIVDLSQQGRVWRLTFRWILGVLADPIEAPNVGLRLRHAWNYNCGEWGAGSAPGSTQELKPLGAGRGGSQAVMIGNWAQPPGGTTTSDIALRGIGWLWWGNDTYGGSEPQEIRSGHFLHGSRQVMGHEWLRSRPDGTGFICTKPDGIDPYGCIFTSIGGPDYLCAHGAHVSNGKYDLSRLIGTHLCCGDQLLCVKNVDEVEGWVYFDRIIDVKTGKVWTQLSAGVSGAAPIELTSAAIIDAASLPAAITIALTGAGALGLGIPPALISDAPVTPTGGASPVWWDWSEGGIDDDLRARGLSVALIDGLFRVISVTPPQSAAAVTTVAQTDLLEGDGPPEIERGYEAPTGSITYQADQVTYTVSYSATTGPGRAALRVLSLESATKDRILDPVAWIRLQASRLRWMAPGIPVIVVRLLSDTLDLGETVLLDTRYIADGNYRSKSLPALVIGRDPMEAEYQLAVAISPDDGCMWALGIEISSVSGAVITPTKQADLDTWVRFVPVGSPVQISQHDQTSVAWAGTVASYQATTITLSSNPTIPAANVAILTLEDIPGSTYGTLQQRQVFAADADGKIDTTYPAKVLT